MPSAFGLRRGHSSSNIWTSIPFGSGLSCGAVPSLHTKTPEFPPSFMCRHSMCRMKFSYCFSERITPIGIPLQTNNPSFTVHVAGEVFTSTQPVRSRPLKSS